MKSLNKQQKKFFIFFSIIVTIIIAATIIAFIIMEKTKKDENKIFGYEFKAYKDLNNQSTYFEYVGSTEEIQLTIFDVPDPEVGKLIIDDHITIFKSVFEPKRVDYPGQYSKTIECPQEYKPTYFKVNISKSIDLDKETFEYFLGYANSNKVAGACSDDLIAYRHVYGMLNCPKNHKILKIEYFTEVNSSVEYFINKVSCNNINII